MKRSTRLVVFVSVVAGSMVVSPPSVAQTANIVIQWN